jgi:hypothetical protein
MTTSSNFCGCLLSHGGEGAGCAKAAGCRLEIANHLVADWDDDGTTCFTTGEAIVTDELLASLGSNGSLCGLSILGVMQPPECATR